MQHKHKFKISISDESKILINAANYRKPHVRCHGNGSSFTLSNKKICKHYGRNGHIIDTYYRKCGFPPHFGKNHVMANQSFLESNEEREDVADSKSCKGNDIYGFTKEHYDKIVNLLHA